MVPGIRRSPPSLVQSDVDGDIRRRLFTYEQQEPKYREEIDVLQQQVLLLTHRASQLEAERDNAHYNTQIWQRRVEEQQELIGERDKAIANLVRHSYDFVSRNDLVQANETAENDLQAEFNEFKLQQERDREQMIRHHEATLKLKNDIIEDLQRQVDQLQSFKDQLTSAQSSQVSNLMQEIKRLRVDLESKQQECYSLQVEMKRIQKDCHEATQSRCIIERDVKLQHLQAENEAQSAELRDLKRELWKAKESSSEIGKLKKALAEAQGEVIALEEANQNTAEEIRRQLEEGIRSELIAAEKTHRYLEERLSQMEAERAAEYASSVQSSPIMECSNEMIRMEENLRDLSKRFDTKSTMLQKSQRKVKRLEVELENAKAKIECLLKQKMGQPSEMDSVSSELQSALQKVESSNNRKQEIQNALDEAESELKRSEQASTAEIDKLHKELESTKLALQASESRIRHLESDLEQMKKTEEALHSQLKESSDSRNFVGALDQEATCKDASEASIISTYERRLLDLTYEKDSVIDGLRKDMTALRAKRTEEVSQLNCDVASLRSELDEIHQTYDEKLKRKEQHIYALEHTLHAQEQTIDNMRVEMDQLQSSMRAAASTRRSEVEDLQEEVIALRTEFSKQEKEVANLRVQLQDEKLEHKTEVLKLKEAIADFETEVPKVKAMARIENDQRILMVKERLEQLRIRNNELKEENKQLGERLEKGIIKIHSLEIKCSEAANFKIECEILRRQVSELQEVLEQHHNFEVSSLPEIEMASSYVKRKPSIKPRSSSVNQNALAQRRTAKVNTSTLARLFTRRKFSAASTAALIADEAEFLPQRSSTSTLPGRAMHF